MSTLPYRQPPGVSLVHALGEAGGTGVSRAAFVAVVLLVDLNLERGADDLRVERIELLDAAGAVLTTTQGAIELRVCLPGRAPFDPSPSGTVPLALPLAAGATRLHTAADLVPYDGPRAARYRASFVVDCAKVILEGPLGAGWPTAGPAPAPRP